MAQITITIKAPDTQDATQQHILANHRFGTMSYIDLEPPSDEELLLLGQKRRNSWKSFFVDSLDKHPIERRYISKLDFFLLSSSMLGYFIKTLNQLNISVAYINGMNEYYSMDKNQYNYLAACWTMGYVLGQVPASLVMAKVSARHFLGWLQISWGVLSILQIYCTLLESLYILRFAVGLAELPYFSAIQFILGSFYLTQEIAKRSTLFSVSSSLAAVISPVIQQIVLEFLGIRNGGLQGFQYMFLLDGLITFPIAVYTMLAIPNTPQTMNTFYFDEQDKLVALERKRRDSGESDAVLALQEEQEEQPVWKHFDTWHIWVFPIMFLCFNNSTSCHGQPTFQTWMKYDLHLPSSSYNLIPSIVSTVGIVAAVSVALIGDYFGKGRVNYFFIKVYFVATFVGCVLLAVWSIPNWLHWSCYVLITIPLAWCQPQIFSWINRLLYAQTSKRSFIVVITNTLAYVTGAWVPIFVWDTRDQPRYFIGFVYTAILSAIGFIVTIVAKRLEDSDRRTILK